MHSYDTKYAENSSLIETKCLTCVDSKVQLDSMVKSARGQIKTTHCTLTTKPSRENTKKMNEWRKNRGRIETVNSKGLNSYRKRPQSF